MTKIAIAITALIGLIMFVLKRWYSREAVKQRRIEKLETEIEIVVIDLEVVKDAMVKAFDSSDNDKLNELQSLRNELNDKLRTLNLKLRKLRSNT